MSREKKEKVRRMRGSLASRILLISIVLLVIPLFIFATFLYFDDLRVKKNNNYLILSVLADQKVSMVKGIISSEIALLSDIAYLLPKIENPEKELTELAARSGVAAIFHIQKDIDGRYLCNLSSKKTLEGKDFTGIIEEAKKGSFFILDSKIPIFYLTRYDPAIEEAWVATFFLSHLTHDFPIEEGVISPASTALIDSMGTVVITTDRKLEGHRFPGPVRRQYMFEGETYISIQRHVPETNFSLLISAPETINFVATPYFFLKIIGAISLIVLIGGGGVFFLTKRLSKPLRSLARMMRYVGKGELTKRFIPQRLGFEINDLGAIFNDTLDSLNEHIEVAHKERLEKETYEQELLIGEEVQSAILPKQLPEFAGVKIAARFIAAKEVGGDFYDFLPKEQLMISIADTSGKGISACLYSLSVRSMLRSYGEIHENLDVIVRETNNLFCQDTGETGIFVTAFVAFFDPLTKIFRYSNCGHFPALLLKKNGEIKKLTTKGMALGVIPFETVMTDQEQLESGDSLLLFTDGVVEAHNEKMKMFGEERLIQLFQEKRALSPKQIVDEMIEELALFAEGCPQFDDLTLIVMKIE